MRISLFLVIALVIGFSLNSYFASESIKTETSPRDTSAVVSPTKTQSLLTRYINSIMTRYSYKKIAVNDSLSEVIFDNYIKGLDRNKMYLTNADFEEFKNFSDEFDDFLLQGELSIPYEIFNRFRKKLTARTEYISKVLENEFDYTADESYLPDREKSPWALSEKELDEIWRKRIKSEALSLKLSGKKWDKIAETLNKRYANLSKAISQYNAQDVYQAFLNSYTETIDPHTNYLSPSTSDNFDINMKLSLEGIGAQLRTESEYTKVVNVIAGGPAAKSGLIKAEDKIIGVGQGDSGEIEDVIGWRIDDVVAKIRGKKGTAVRLLLVRGELGEAKPDTIMLIREKVKLEEQAAKKKTFEVFHDKKKYKIGVIEIPAFYRDFEAMRKGESDFRSTTTDVKKLLIELSQEDVDGIIVDLRDNGGGSLDEAIELTGLFIEDGPVVQVKRSNGSIEVNNDEDPSLYYKGPLAVLVNRFSASASEIFSGAIQDYGRGIVLGENTFGKGTVQTLVDLDKMININREKLGSLKVTIAKFYRISGGSTQHKGVAPDVEFPGVYEAEDVGESSYPSALPWDMIKPAEYRRLNNFGEIVPKLNKLHDARIKLDREFGFILEDIEEFKKKDNEKVISLNEQVRRKEMDKAEAKKKERNKLRGISEKDAEVEDKVKDLNTEDPYLFESGHIIADFISLSGR